MIDYLAAMASDMANINGQKQESPSRAEPVPARHRIALVFRQFLWLQTRCCARAARWECGRARLCRSILLDRYRERHFQRFASDSLSVGELVLKFCSSLVGHSTFYFLSLFLALYDARSQATIQLCPQLYALPSLKNPFSLSLYPILTLEDGLRCFHSGIFHCRDWNPSRRRINVEGVFTPP
jgi:hypothetical protein